MPRDGSGVFSPPAGTTATAGTPIESAKYNAFVNDLVADANTARPIVAGGTGATTAAGAWTAISAGAPTTGAGVVPAGAILLWSGSIASIPAGWQLCNGTNGTPDLRDKFIVGAGAEYDVGETGGANTVSLTAAQNGAHTHAVVGNTSSDGNHTHGGSLFKSGSSFIIDTLVGALHGAGNTDSAGAHAHSINFTSGSSGTGAAHENRPPYFALCYIMKL